MLQTLEQDIQLVWMFVTLYVQYVIGFGAALGLVGVLTLLYKLEGWRENKRKAKFNQSIRKDGERWMTTPEEENLEKVLMSDMVVDIIEELIHRGKLSPERARIWYRRFGNILNLPDLLEQHEQLLKQRIRSQIGKSVKVIPFPDVRKVNGLRERVRAQRKQRSEHA